MRWARTHNGVSRAPLMGFHTRTADDKTHTRNVKALERSTLRKSVPKTQCTGRKSGIIKLAPVMNT